MKNSRRVVITGLGVVAPNGIGKETFWQNLIAGKSAIDYITAFDASPYPCQVAGEVRDFDPEDFLTSRKAKMMGRFSQLAVAATRLPLEDAQVSGRRWQRTWPSVRDLGIWSRGCRRRRPRLCRQRAGRNKALDGSRISSARGCQLSGYRVRDQWSCSNNLLKLLHWSGRDQCRRSANRLRSNRSGNSGRLRCSTLPIIFDAFCSLGALTKRNDDPTKASRPYDLLRDGIVLAEGGATVILEELEAAMARGATIYAEVLGHNAASEAIGMRKGDLSGEVMAATIRSAIRNSDLIPEDIDHINAHGSSLPDFDICDTKAFRSPSAVMPTAFPSAQSNR